MTAEVAAALYGAAVGGVIGLVGGFASVFLANGLQQRREDRQRQSDKRLLAGALAAELRGILERWNEIKADYKEQAGWSVAPRWSLDESYFSVFEGIAHRLSLLPPDVATKTVSCYVKMKVVQDNLRLATQAEGSRPLVLPVGRGKLDDFVRRATERAMKYADEATNLAKDLVRELEAIAEGC